MEGLHRAKVQSMRHDREEAGKAPCLGHFVFITFVGLDHPRDGIIGHFVVAVVPFYLRVLSQSSAALQQSGEGLFLERQRYVEFHQLKASAQRIEIEVQHQTGGLLRGLPNALNLVVDVVLLVVYLGFLDTFLLWTAQIIEGNLNQQK